MSTKKTTAAKAAPAPGGADTTPLENSENLFRAISSFVRSNANFESSTIIDSAIATIGRITNLRDAFLAPIKSCLFSADAALHWLIFLHMAPGRAAELGDTATYTPLGDSASLGTIVSVYDAAIEEVVWDHFEEEDGDDEDDDGEDEEE
jgi:hypothetical protein